MLLGLSLKTFFEVRIMKIAFLAFTWFATITYNNF